MKLNTPPGTPASRKHRATSYPEMGVALAGLNTTVFPATIAPDDIPAESACGKLNGASTAQTPNGRRMDTFFSLGSSDPIGVRKPAGPLTCRGFPSSKLG